MADEKIYVVLEPLREKTMETRFRHRLSTRHLLAGLAVLLIFSVPPASHADSINEIALRQTVNMLPTAGQHDISMILKTWESTGDANDHFQIRFYNLVNEPTALTGYYEHILAFDHGKKVEFQDLEGPDCSFSKTAIFKIPSGTKYILAVITADRIEATDGSFPVQANPRPQRLRYFSLKRNVSEQPGKSSVWLEMAREIVTKEKLCDIESVHRAMTDFAAAKETP